MVMENMWCFFVVFFLKILAVWATGKLRKNDRLPLMEVVTSLLKENIAFVASNHLETLNIVQSMLRFMA